MLYTVASSYEYVQKTQTNCSTWRLTKAGKREEETFVLQSNGSTPPSDSKASNHMSLPYTSEQYQRRTLSNYVPGDL